ncbi:MAG: serine/threonine protein kinase [Phycisphaerales bacterium]|nr:serine/threonine protein kinase [Phycisphaerales bacterium]
MRARTFAQLPAFEFVDRLGKGAHAVIYLAVERSTRTRFAIKHIVRRKAEDDRFLEQAQTEYEVARQFEHPYLRRCFDIVRVRKWLRTQELFLTMEYAEGETLESQCPVSIEGIVALFAKVAEGLGALHRLGYAHADMKPNNIILTRDGGLKIIDFGQSCPLGTRKTRVQGTPDYMAPEQVWRREIDQRTDVFNLGATMYWVVTGKAFRTQMQTAPTGSKMIELEARVDNAPPHELNPRVPVALSKLISECVETAPDRRPRDMRDVVSRLETIQLLLAKRAAADRGADAGSPKTGQARP